MKALIIEILCKAIFLFFIHTKPTNRSKAVEALSTAWKNGKERKSAPPKESLKSSGKNISPATAKGIITDRATISGM